MESQQDRLPKLDQATLLDTIALLEQRVNSLEKQARELKERLQ